MLKLKVSSRGRPTCSAGEAFYNTDHAACAKKD